MTNWLKGLKSNPFPALQVASVGDRGVLAAPSVSQQWGGQSFLPRLEWAFELTQKFWAFIPQYWWPCILPPRDEGKSTNSHCKAYFSSVSAFSLSAQFRMIFSFSAFIPLIKVPEAGSMRVWAGMFGAESLALIFYTALKSIHSSTLYSDGQRLALVGSPRALGFWVSWETGGSCPPTSLLGEIKAPFTFSCPLFYISSLNLFFSLISMLKKKSMRRILLFKGSNTLFFPPPLFNVAP